MGSSSRFKTGLQLFGSVIVQSIICLWAIVHGKMNRHEIIHKRVGSQFGRFESSTVHPFFFIFSNYLKHFLTLKLNRQNLTVNL